MLLPLLRSTLFPYTTLFRSLGGKAESEFEAEGEAAIATDGLSRSNLVGLGPRGHAGAGGNGAVTTPAPGGRLRRSGRRESVPPGRARQARLRHGRRSGRVGD